MNSQNEFKFLLNWMLIAYKMMFNPVLISMVKDGELKNPFLFG